MRPVAVRAALLKSFLLHRKLFAVAQKRFSAGWPAILYRLRDVYCALRTAVRPRLTLHWR